MDEFDRHRRILLSAGALLVLLGLVSGLFVDTMANPRMGLSAHLEAVFNGLLLIALGCAWQWLALSRRWRMVALGLVLYGTFANWLTTQLAALWGTGRMTPLAAPGRVGTALHEGMVSFGLVTLSVAMIAAFSIIAFGFLRAR